MRTKLFTLIAAIAFTFGATNVFAQEAGDGGTTPVVTNEGKVNLTIELNPIQTLVVNESQKNVALKYETLEHYEKGVSSENEKHLSVTSTGGYEINVKALDFTYDTNADNLNKISLSHIGLVTSGSTINKAYTSLSGLTNGDQQIVLSDFGGVGEEYNVTYSAKGANEYLKNNYIKGEQVKLHTTVTYTIVAK